MKATDKIDAARIDLLLGELRLPGIKLIWAALAATADKEGWPAARFLAALAEQEMVERSRRRFERHLEEARLPPGKTLDAFDFDAVPMISKAQVQALAAGDAWLEKGANLLCFGPPGGGKSHLAAALGMALIEKGWRVLFTRTTDLVQKLQIARRDLVLEAAIAKLDKYHLLILDDLAYVTKDQAETSVLFELISARYERRSMLITANQPFGEWGKIFPDQAMTLAAIDRLVHHATILEMNVDSYRRKEAIDKARVASDARQRARQSKDPLDCRATTIKSRVTKIPLALSSRRDNHPSAATAKMAILIVAAFPSRLSRYKLRRLPLNAAENTGSSRCAGCRPRVVERDRRGSLRRKPVSWRPIRLALRQVLVDLEPDPDRRQRRCAAIGELGRRVGVLLDQGRVSASARREHWSAPRARSGDPHGFHSTHLPGGRGRRRDIWPNARLRAGLGSDRPLLEPRSRAGSCDYRPHGRRTELHNFGAWISSRIRRPGGLIH